MILARNTLLAGVRKGGVPNVVKECHKANELSSFGNGIFSKLRNLLKILLDLTTVVLNKVIEDLAC